VNLAYVSAYRGPTRAAGGADDSQTNPRDVLVDESKQADIENLGDCLRALGDGQQLGDFSLTIVLYGRSKSELEHLAGEFTGVFTNADGNLFVETYNQLNAYFATVPGNYAMNLRKLYMLNSNYADLSFLFTILPGEKANPHLGSEYLAVLETDNSTPYFLNLHNGEVAHTLILGMTGSGKSYFCNFILQNAQKYAPLTFIFDIGGSFQSLTSIFGGSYLNVGQEARDFTINPFSLAPTKENLQFLFSFFRVLIEGSGHEIAQRYRIDFKEERKLWDAIERVYVLEPAQRTLSNFADIIGELKERLHRWTRGGQHAFLFDNAEDTLSFSRFQTFNFAGWGDAPDVLEPLLFYVLHRASNEIADAAKLATFKLFLLDEAWLFIKNETIRNYVVQAQKSSRCSVTNRHRRVFLLMGDDNHYGSEDYPSRSRQVCHSGAITYDCLRPASREWRRRLRHDAAGAVARFVGFLRGFLCRAVSEDAQSCRKWRWSIGDCRKTQITGTPGQLSDSSRMPRFSHRRANGRAHALRTSLPDSQHVAFAP
jgi:type IV secretion system protein VirB4